MRIVVFLIAVALMWHLCKRDTNLKFSEPQTSTDGKMLQLLDSAGVNFPLIALARQRLEVKDLVVGITDSEMARWQNVYAHYRQSIDEYVEEQRRLGNIKTEEEYVNILDSVYTLEGDSTYVRRMLAKLAAIKLMQD